MCVLFPDHAIQYNKYDIDTVQLEHRITHHLLYLRKIHPWKNERRSFRADGYAPRNQAPPQISAGAAGAVLAIVCAAAARRGLFDIFHYIPLYGVQIAFRDYRPRNGFLGSTWVGLKHFKYFLNSPQFPQLMRNTVLLSLYSLIFTFPLPILLALLLNECGSVGYKKFVQNVTYAPHFISTVVLCGMVIAFTAPDTGIINSLVVLLGGKSVDYMTQESSWRAIYVISDIWKNTGWSSIIYLAALAGIDPQLHESAQIDGASRLQRVWHINLPGIRQTIILLFILDCGKIMSVGFEKAYLLQNALNLPVSEIISTYVYKTGVQGA